MSASLEAALASASNRAALHTLYRRLRRHGEEESMIRSAIASQSLESNVRTASKLLKLHTRTLELMQRRSNTLFINVPARVMISLQKRRIYYAVLGIRLGLRSWSAIKEVITTVVFMGLMFLFYQMYRICRIGLELADAKYQQLAIPVLQTLEALEMAERKKETRRKEMESDMTFERNLVKGAPRNGQQ